MKRVSTSPNLASTKRHLLPQIWPPQKGINQPKSHLHEEGIHRPESDLHRKASTRANLTSTKRLLPPQIWPPQKGIYQPESDLHKKASTRPNLTCIKRHLAAWIWPPQKGIYQISLHKKASTSRLFCSAYRDTILDRIGRHESFPSESRATIPGRTSISWPTYEKEASCSQFITARTSAVPKAQLRWLWC